MLHANYIIDSLRDGCLAPKKHSYFLGFSAESSQKFRSDVDAFGDSHVEDTTPRELARLFINMDSKLAALLTATKNRVSGSPRLSRSPLQIKASALKPAVAPEHTNSEDSELYSDWIGIKSLGWRELGARLIVDRGEVRFKNRKLGESGESGESGELGDSGESGESGDSVGQSGAEMEMATDVAVGPAVGRTVAYSHWEEALGSSDECESRLGLEGASERGAALNCLWEPTMCIYFYHPNDVDEKSGQENRVNEGHLGQDEEARGLTDRTQRAVCQSAAVRMELYGARVSQELNSVVTHVVLHNELYDFFLSSLSASSPVNESTPWPSVPTVMMNKQLQCLREKLRELSFDDEPCMSLHSEQENAGESFGNASVRFGGSSKVSRMCFGRTIVPLDWALFCLDNKRIS